MPKFGNFFIIKNVRKKKILYSIYCVSILVALSLFLVFHNNTSTNSQQSEIYAAGLTLNCSRSINIPVGTSFEFENGFINVSPVEAKSSMSCEIVAKTGSASDGLILNDNVFYANEIGIYNLKYSVASSETKSLSETIVVNVVEESSPILNIDTLKVEEDFAIQDVFNLNANADVDISVDKEMINLTNDTLTPISNGETEIEISFTENFVKLNKVYLINILPADFYNIRIDSVLVKDMVCTIQYKVLNNDETVVNQNLKVVIDNPNVSVINNCSPILEIMSTVKEKVNLTLYLEEQKNVKVNLTIDFNNE